MDECLKRNSAFLDRHIKTAIPPFSRWFRGVLSQRRSHHLRNLDYSEAIGLYVQLFGRENICVLPMEMIAKEGERAYLQKLCEHMNISLSDSDVDRFKVVHNRRMSSRRNIAAELITDDRFESLLDDLSGRFGPGEIDSSFETFLEQKSHLPLTKNRRSGAGLVREIGSLLRNSDWI